MSALTCPVCIAIAENFSPTPEPTKCGHVDDCPDCTCARAPSEVVDFGVNPSRETLAAAGFNADSPTYRAALTAFDDETAN